MSSKVHCTETNATEWEGEKTGDKNETIYIFVFLLWPISGLRASGVLSLTLQSLKTFSSCQTKTQQSDKCGGKSTRGKHLWGWQLIKLRFNRWYCPSQTLVLQIVFFSPVPRTQEVIFNLSGSFTIGACIKNSTSSMCVWCIRGVVEERWRKGEQTDKPLALTFRNYWA